MTDRILLLGGTTEARQIAEVLAAYSDCAVTMSLAGRTEKPVTQPVPVRTGGFGGVDGLAAYLHDQRVNLLIDATHPYAARISANAAQAAQQAGVPIVAMRRPAWEAVEGDRWTLVDDAAGAVASLGKRKRAVFLALGRQDLLPFEAAPQHRYVIRSVDPVDPPLNLPNATYILQRGPFDLTAETKLLRTQRIGAVVAKNSGGSASYGKIAAARKLGVEVVLIQRPPLPDVAAGETVAQVCSMVVHALGLDQKRGA
jgi:precorrin-6A/cobalt-precorrin-6A reductase